MMSPRKRMDMEESGPTKRMAKGGAAGGVKKMMAVGGCVRGDGIAMKGKTKGRMV
jgi:hypothetical protein